MGECEYRSVLLESGQRVTARPVVYQVPDLDRACVVANTDIGSASFPT